MFCNILRTVARGRACGSHQKIVAQSMQIRGTAKATTTTDAEIEANLFENSAIRHKPLEGAELREALKRSDDRGHKAWKPRRRDADAAPHKRSASAAASSTSKSKWRNVNANITDAPEPHSNRRTIDDAELGLRYVRLDMKDRELSALLTAARSRKRHEEERAIIIEGRRLIRDALECKLKLRALLFSQPDQLRLLIQQVVQAQRTSQAELYKVPQHDLKTWSTLTTPPGLLAIFQRPSAKGIEQLQAATALPLTVVCDNIREPNNLGSIVRTCAALPCAQVIVTRGCCDVWEEKALRGGCGGHFRIPIRDNVDWSDLPMLIPAEAADNCCVFVAENRLPSKLPAKQNVVPMHYADVQRTGAHNVVIIGGETHGVSQEAYNFMNIVGDKGKCLYIPVAAGVDSLNVVSALTLILYELRKHLSPASMQLDTKESASTESVPHTNSQ